MRWQGTKKVLFRSPRPSGPAAEVTDVTFNLPAGTFTSMNIFASDLGIGQAQIVTLRVSDTLAVNGAYVYVWASGQQLVYWFNQGREQVVGQIGDPSLTYGLFDFDRNGVLDMWSASSDALYFEGFLNDGLGNFSGVGPQYTGMDSFGAPLEFHIRTIGAQTFLRATMDGSDIYDCEIFTDGSVGGFAFIASSGYVHVAPVLSGNLDGSGGNDTIDSFDTTFNVFGLHLTRYGPASASNPGVGTVELEVGYRSTDTIAQIATKLCAAINRNVGTASMAASDTVQFTTDSGLQNDPGGSTTSFDAQVIQYGSSANINPGDWIYILASYVNGSFATFACYFVIDGNGSGPGIADTEGPIYVASGSDFNTVGAAIADAINAISFDSILSAAWVPGSYCSVSFGFVGPADFNSSSAYVAADIGSTGTVQQYSGAILFNTPTTNYYAWFPMGSWNSNPSIAGRTGVSVSASPGATTTQLATAFKTAMNAVAAKTYTVSDLASNSKRVTNNATGAVTDASKTIGSAVSVSVSTQGR